MNKKRANASIEDANRKIRAHRAEIKRLNAKLAMSSAAFLNIVGKSSDGVIIIDKKKMIVYTNYAAIKLFARNVTDFLSEPLAIDFDDIVNNTVKEIHLPKIDGGETIAEMSIVKTEWNNEPCFIVSLRDITEKKKSEEMLEYIATHDYLTDLPNRNYLEKQIEKAMQYASEYKSHMAVIYLDLDNFKHINDTYGHEVGDHLLKMVSNLLLQSVRTGDTVARIGGDEFVVILHALRKPDYAGLVSQTILDKLSQPFRINNQEMFINASIGIAVYPFCGTFTYELLKNADTAMYAAKAHGKNQYRFFTKELSKQSEQELLILNGVRNILRHEELQLQYQPIIDLKTMQCNGIEALVRWQHPHLGLLYPEQFLSFFEESETMIEVGKWIVHHALSDYLSLTLPQPSFIAINMSAAEFTAKNVEHMILSSLEKHAIPEKHLIIEITERVVMHHPKIIIDKIQHLTKTGARVAIDDYGKGYSALSLLKKLPVNILKIDKTFVSDIEKDNNNRIIIQSTIQLAHHLGLKVIGEGVETEEQMLFLQKLGCDYAQGYYFAKPLNIDELKIKLEQTSRS